LADELSTADQLAIRDVISRYCWAIDTGDIEGFVACFASDGVLRQGDGPHLLNVMGWYEDGFRREDGEWKLAKRIIRDWSGPVVGKIAGQTGERVARPLPPPLAGLVYPASED
jgi:hypothetical protein